VRYVIGRIKARPGMREAYLALATEFIATSRAEAGCVYYDQGPLHGDPDGMIIVECWATPQAHAAHVAASHFKAFGPVFEKHVLKAIFEEMDVGDVNNVVIDMSKAAG
jgi:quinol monooxygenase YgiN